VDHGGVRGGDLVGDSDHERGQFGLGGVGGELEEDGLLNIHSFNTIKRESKNELIPF
jgi:hypothetical protein